MNFCLCIIQEVFASLGIYETDREFTKSLRKSLSYAKANVEVNFHNSSVLVVKMLYFLLHKLTYKRKEKNI